MSRARLILVASVLALAQVAGAGTYAAVSDDVKLLDAQTKAEITAVGTRLYDAGTCQFMVKVVAKADDLEKESREFFRKTGIGDAKLNNGLLVYVNADGVRKNKKPRFRVEVGYGLEGLFPDGKCGRLMDEAMAAGNGNFNTTVSALTTSISAELGKADVPKVLAERRVQRDKADRLKRILIAIGVCLYLICFAVAPGPTLEVTLWLLYLLASCAGKGGSGGGGGGRGFGGGSCGGGGASR